MNQTLVVTVDRTSTVSITKKEPELTTVVNESTVATSPAPSPDPVYVDVETNHIHQLDTARGPQGPQGVQGPKGDVGDINGTTDNLAEGVSNLYFTEDRAHDVAQAAASAQLSLHTADPDPHTQYRAKNDAIDGGFF